MAGNEGYMPNGLSPETVFDNLLDADDRAFVGPSGLTLGGDDVCARLEQIRTFYRDGMLNEGQQDLVIEIATKHGYDLTVF